MTRQEIEALIDSRTVAYIASVDGEGFPNLKAMLAPRVREGLRTFYFTTNTHSMRVEQYRRDPKAAIYFCDEDGFRGVMLRGEMETLTGARAIRSIIRWGLPIPTTACCVSRPATGEPMPDTIRKIL